MDETMDTTDTSETFDPSQQSAAKLRGKRVKNNLKRERELLGWSRTYVAQKIGSDIQTIGRWERGTISPSPFYRQALCELFRKNAAELGLLKDDAQEPVSLAAEVKQEELSFKDVPAMISHVTKESSESASYAPFPYRPYTPAPVTLSFRGLLGIIAFGVTIALLCTLFFGFVAWRMSPSSFSFMALSGRQSIKPGGLWISPLNKQTVHGIIYFAAKAFPTNPGDPPINHVNFTINWQNGGWRIGCVAYPPVVENLYICTAVLTLFPAPPGKLRISFDVYDQLGNINFAPNGIHTVVYAP